MAGQATTFSWTDLLRGMGSWLRHNLPRALVMSAISFAFGWVVNFWVMAFRWDGFRAPSGESDYIAAQNSLVSGSLFWAALTSFLFAVIAYGHRAGWGQLRREVFGLPGRIGAMFKGEERNRSLTTLTWALALSLLLALVISPGVAAIAAGFFLAFAATPLGDLLSGLIRRLWVQVVARFAPHKGEPTSEVGAAAVTAAGMLAGFVIAATVDVFLLKVLAVILAALAAYYFANEDELGPAGGAAVFLLIAAAVGLYELFEAGVGVALADDGGWSECGNCNVIDYVTSTGATEVVSRSTVAGAGAGVGAPIGASVGDVLGSIGGGGGGGDVGGGAPDDAAPDAPAPDSGAADDDILGSIGGGEGTVQTDDQPAPSEPAGEDGTVRTAGDITPDRGRRGPDAPDDAAPVTDDAPPAPVGDGSPSAPPTDAPTDATPPDQPPTDQPATDAPADDDLLGAIGGGDGTLPGGDAAGDGAPDTTTPPGGGTAEVPPTRRPGAPDPDAAVDPEQAGAAPPVMPPPVVPPLDPPTGEAPPPPDDLPPQPGMPPPVAPTDMPPPVAPTDMPPPEAPTDMPPPTPPEPEPPPAPEPDPAAPPMDGADTPPAAEPPPSTNVWGRDLSGWLNDAATKLGEAKDTLEGWIDDVWGEDEASGIKDTLQTERIGENLQQVVDATDTYNHFHDMAGETIDDLDRLGIDENGQNAVTWLRVVTEGAGRAAQTFVDNIVTPVLEPIVAPFGGDAGEVAHTLLPVQETAEEASQAIHNAARNIRGGDNYAGQIAENRDLDLEALWRFP